MKYIKERLLTGAIFSLFSVLAIMLIQVTAKYFHHESLQPGNLFTLPYILGSFFIGFCYYHTLLSKPTRLDTRAFHFYALRKGAAASVLAYVVGVICLILVVSISFYVHAYTHESTRTITEQMGYFAPLIKIVTVTFKKTIEGFTDIALHHFGLVLMAITSALAGLTLARLRGNNQLG